MAKNSSQNSVYNKVGVITVNIAYNGDVCVAQQIVRNTWWCILLDAAQISVQPGDILGLELPHNDHEIYFTKEGPENCVFQYQLDSTIRFSSDNSCMYDHQLPQISFKFTSGT